MDIQFHLQNTDIPRTGREALAPPPQPLWAEHERGGLIYSLRFLSQEQRPVLSDVRVRPVDAGGLPWEFPNAPETVPAGGLDVTAIHNTGWASIRDAALIAMSDPNHPVWEQAGFERWEQWHDIVPAAGIDREQAAPQPRGGRPSLPDEHWAIVALHYVGAFESGFPIHRYIRDQMAEGDEHLPTENWVAETRKRGFLTPSDRAGRRGGALTKKAREILRQMGQLPGDEPDEGGVH